MTPKQAIEVGQLAKTLNDLARESADMRRIPDSLIGFADDLFVPRAVFRAMVEAGRAEASRRLKALGVRVPK